MTDDEFDASLGRLAQCPKGRFCLRPDDGVREAAANLRAERDRLKAQLARAEAERDKFLAELLENGSWDAALKNLRRQIAEATQRAEQIEAEAIERCAVEAERKAGARYGVPADDYSRGWRRCATVIADAIRALAD